MELDDILSDAPEPEVPAVETPPVEVPVEGAEQPPAVALAQSKRKDHQAKEFAAQGLERDANGQWKKREEAAAVQEVSKMPEAPVTPPVVEMTAKEKAFLAQATDERRKRQELEAKLKALETPKAAETPEDFWKDPQAALKASEQRTQEMIVNTRLQTVEALARSRLPDFDEKIAGFKEYLDGQIPAVAQSIAQRWLTSQDPAQFAYDFAKTQADLKEMGDMPAYKAKIEADAYAKGKAAAEAEFKAKAEKAAADRAAIPGSLSNARGSNPVTPVWGGPPSLEDILSN